MNQIAKNKFQLNEYKIPEFKSPVKRSLHFSNNFFMLFCAVIFKPRHENRNATHKKC